MKSYRIEPHVLQANAGNEIQSLAPRLNPNPVHRERISNPLGTGPRFPPICARIGIAMLYVACHIAAIAQSPEQLRLRLRNERNRLPVHLTCGKVGGTNSSSKLAQISRLAVTTTARS